MNEWRYWFAWFPVETVKVLFRPEEGISWYEDDYAWFEWIECRVGPYGGMEYRRIGCDYDY